MKRETIRTDTAAASRNPVAQGMKFGNLIFTAGATPRDPKTGEIIRGDMRDHVRATLNNIKFVIEAGGSSLENVLRVTCYLEDIENDFDAWNEVYKEFFPKDWPARTTIQAKLRGGATIEVDVIACVPT